MISSPPIPENGIRRIPLPYSRRTATGNKKRIFLNKTENIRGSSAADAPFLNRKKFIMKEFEAVIILDETNPINPIVYVPKDITDSMKANKGYIPVSGMINGFDFQKNLVSTRNGVFKLHIDQKMLKGSNSKINQSAKILIEETVITKEVYELPEYTKEILEKNGLHEKYVNLRQGKKNEIQKYLSRLKNKEILRKHTARLLEQLKTNQPVRIP